MRDAYQVAAVRAAEHLVGRELYDGGLEPGLVDDHRRGIGFEDRAGEDDRERLADAQGWQHQLHDLEQDRYDDDQKQKANKRPDETFVAEEPDTVIQ